MIKSETKLTYQLKNVSFSGNGNLLDEEAEIVTLLSDLKAIFGDKQFTLTAQSSDKTDLTVDDFEAEGLGE